MQTDIFSVSAALHLAASVAYTDQHWEAGSRAMMLGTTN